MATADARLDETALHGPRASVVPDDDGRGDVLEIPTTRGSPRAWRRAGARDPKYGSTLLGSRRCAIGSEGAVLNSPAVRRGKRCHRPRDDLIRGAGGRHRDGRGGDARAQYPGFRAPCRDGAGALPPFDLNRQGLILRRGRGVPWWSLRRTPSGVACDCSRGGRRPRHDVRRITSRAQNSGVGAGASARCGRPSSGAASRRTRSTSPTRTARARSTNDSAESKVSEGRLRRPQGAHLQYEEYARSLHGRGERARGDRLPVHCLDQGIYPPTTPRDARSRLRRRRGRERRPNRQE